jgi:hypothetical protein
MFERIPRLKAVLDDQKHERHRRLIGLAVEHQRPVVRMIRDGFPEPTRTEVIEFNVRKQVGRRVTLTASATIAGEGYAERENITGNFDSNPFSRFNYAKHLLILPERPGFCITDFAQELGTALDSLKPDEVRAAKLPAAFDPETNKLFFSHFTMRANSSLNMAILLKGARQLMREHCLFEAVKSAMECASDAAQSKAREAGIDIASITSASDGQVSYVQGGCRRTLNLERSLRETLEKTYTKYLNPVAERIAFAFSPEL